jgi:hypothetical protein
MSRDLPSGRKRGLMFVVADDWTPEQALAVVELLDDLREVIYARYLFQIRQTLQADRQTMNADPRQQDLAF